MTIELPALDTEPLIYFLLHSGVFVAALASIFFLLGLGFGASLWARYKHRAKSLASEGEELRNDIADLKRKLAEQAFTAAPRAPAPQRNVPDIRDAPAITTTPAPTPTLADVPAMPELAAAPVAAPDPIQVRPPAAARPSPAPVPVPELAAPARQVARRSEPAAVAPFGFLMDDTEGDSPGRGSSER